MSPAGDSTRLAFATPPPAWASTSCDSKLLVFVVAAAGTGLCAALLTVQTPFIQPNASFSIQWSAAASFMAVVGGLGTVEVR